MRCIMKDIINWHYKKYPLMTNQDLYKLILQSEIVGSHLISSPLFSLQYLNDEANKLQPLYQDLYEYIGNDFLRVYLRPYIKYQLSLEYLNGAFVTTVNNNHGNKAAFMNRLNEFNLKDKNFYNDEYSCHHSKVYSDNYFPNYRVIKNQYVTDEMKYIQIHNFISNLNRPCIISLEGKCGAGKTTITNKLKDAIDITVINIDDFFLPQERKTAARLNETGGNIDYESIYQLLETLSHTKNVTYFRYNCSNRTYEKVQLQTQDIIILEGVYSYHPYFRKFIDKLIYLDINYDTQLQRLKTRSNFGRFVNEWIPLENNYFDHENIKYNANLII